jgi:branched-chain amino acid transport system substrate-binding protein
LAIQVLAAVKKRLSLVPTATTNALTNQQCSPFGGRWTFDSYSIAKTVAATLATPGLGRFLLGVDNAGGDGMQSAPASFLCANGAKTVGSVHHFVTWFVGDASPKAAA